MAALASNWLRHFRLLLWNHWTEFNETWQEGRSQHPLPSCVFRADRKNKIAALGSDWPRQFRLLLWNCWTEFTETWQEASSQRPLPSLCFSGRSKKKHDGRPGLWFAETFSTSLKPLNGIQWNLTGRKISTSSTKFVFFRPIGKTRWLPWPLIDLDIFDFSSETAERNSTKLDRKQDLNVLYQVIVFRAYCKNIFDFSSETTEQPATKLDRKKDLNVLYHYQVCVFWGRSEKQDGRPGQSVKQVAHWTQVHDMWPFGPLVRKLWHSNRDRLWNEYKNVIYFYFWLNFFEYAVGMRIYFIFNCIP